MTDFLQIPDKCRMNNSIPLERFDIKDDAVNNANVIGIIKPELSKVYYSETDINHIGEIVIIQLDLNGGLIDLYSILRGVFKNIKYKCIVILKFQDKFKISTCRFNPGKIDPSANILKNIIISCWIHPELMSQVTQNSVNSIREALNSNLDLDSIYANIHAAVVNINQRGTSEAHAKRIVQGVTGNKYNHEYKKIFKYCTPIRYHKPKSSRLRYSSERETNYILLHDYEEIWYCLNKYEKTRQIIEARGFKNMDELLYYIESEPWY